MRNLLIWGARFLLEFLKLIPNFLASLSEEQKINEQVLSNYNIPYHVR